jgi:GT2 family glycosyltransferase
MAPPFRDIWRRLTRPFSDVFFESVSQSFRGVDERLAVLQQRLGVLESQSAITDNSETLRALGLQVAALSRAQASTADLRSRNSIPLPASPRVSIVVPTDTRTEALDNLLSCLRFLDGPEFEVVVVRGPTEEGMAEVLAKWAGAIKLARNPVRNISISRNLGIAMASGDIVALIDDDGLPESDWLTSIVEAFEDPEVGGASGVVMDHTGTTEEARCLVVNRLGRMDTRRSEPNEAYNFPWSFNFPFLPGVNSAFRRDALIAVGGFDEEFEYWYDETDLCCRLVDAGWSLRQLPGARVHHKYLASHLRTSTRILREMFTPLKGKLYFSLINNRGHFPMSRALSDMTDFINEHRQRLEAHVAKGELPPSDLEAYAQDVERAWAAGLERGLSGQRRLMTPPSSPRGGKEFLPFPRLWPAGGRRRFVFTTEGSDSQGVVERAARMLAETGHHVHLVSPAEGHDTVDFEETFWIHRFLAHQDAVLDVALRFRADEVHIYVENGSSDDGWAAAVARRLVSETDDLDVEALAAEPGWVVLSLTGIPIQRKASNRRSA